MIFIKKAVDAIFGFNSGIFLGGGRRIWAECVSQHVFKDNTIDTWTMWGLSVPNLHTVKNLQ